MLQLKPSGLVELLVSAFAMKEPVTIVGEPGIGKTQIIEQVAKMVGADLIKSHPALDDPTDGKGLPWFTGSAQKQKAEFVPIGQFARVMNSKRPTIWLLDDFLQAPDAVRNTYMQWLHGRECAGHKLPDHVMIIIATNDRTHRAGVVGGMIEPLKSRTTIVQLVADRAEWSEWLMDQEEIEGVELSIDLRAEQVAFAKFKPDQFMKFEPNTDLKNSPNPRTWVKAMKWLTMGLSTEVEMAALSGVVGEAAAGERIAFRKMYATLPTIDAILMNPDKADIPTDLSVLYAVALALATQATDKTFGRIVKYAERMVAAGFGDFASLLIRDITRMKPELQKTPTFVKLMTGELGKLVGGE